MGYQRRPGDMQSIGGSTEAIPSAAGRNLTSSDIEKIVDYTGAGAGVFTLQTDAIMGTSGAEVIAITQIGAGTPSFAAGPGVLPIEGTAPTFAQWLTFGVRRFAANRWVYL